MPYNLIKVCSVMWRVGFVHVFICREPPMTRMNEGRYKQWNGLLEWNTVLDYWTELFSFL